MKRIKRIITSVLLALMLVIILALPAMAIDDPDDPPSINAVYVFENVLEEGDAGVLIDYFIDYTIAGIPDETVTDAYLAIFIDDDGVTQLEAVAPYTFVSSGYGRGLVWIYFTAAQYDTYGLAVADIADYRIWLVGNPTLAWAGDPPKTITTIDQWNTVDDPSVILALRVLYYADALELLWALDLVEVTALGNRLTTVGASYFENAITNLRTMAPGCFAEGTVYPELEDIDYSTEFGGVAEGLIVVGSPDTLAEGTQVVTTNNTGTFTITLQPGTSGTIADLGGNLSVTPADLVAGENTIIVTALGTFTVVLSFTNTQVVIDTTVEGTGFDLTEVADRFGMSRIMFSSLLWFMLTVIICGATYAGVSRTDAFGGASSSGNAVMLMFALCIVGGTLMGLMAVVVASVLVLGWAAYIGYVIFFRGGSGDIGRTLMFMGWMWLATIIVGGITVSSVPQVSTVLTADIGAATDPITVASTEGFAEPSIIVIGDERIAYADTGATTFTGTTWRPLARGVQDTEAVAHSEGDSVRTIENSLLNNSLNYNVALLSDPSGLMSFVTVPLVIWSIIMSFIFLPLGFLGTDMVILTFIWGIIAIGFVVSVFIALAGGRRV